MGRLVTGTILYVCFAFCVVGCKTKQHSEYKADRLLSVQQQQLTQSMIGVSIKDSILENMKRTLSGKVLFWSEPDSIGNQHKVVEIDFTEKQSTSKKQINNEDIALQVDQEQHRDVDRTDTSVFRSEKSSDSRIFNEEFVLSIVGIGLIFFVVWLLKREWDNN